MNLDESFLQPSVLQPQQLEAIDRGNGAKTIPLVTSQLGSQRFLNGMTIFQPGAKIAHHSHNVPESVMVIKGQAIVNIDGTEHSLETFDTTFVPANIAHHFQNASETEEMRIFWTYGSIDATRTIIETGITARIDSEQSRQNQARPVIENALIKVKPGTEDGFEKAVSAAIPIFQKATGARSFELERFTDRAQTYQLRIVWQKLEDHTLDFRSSPGFTLWRELVGEFFAEPPHVTHSQNVITGF